MCHANTNKKKEEVSMLISERTDIKAKTIFMDIKGYYLMIKGVNTARRYTILNVYIPNNKVSKYVR